MARTDFTEAQPADPTASSLNRLLGRLEHTLLSRDGDPTLRTSSFARNKVNANIEYARSLLLRLEHENAGVKAQTRRANLQADLRAKRDLIKRLTNQLDELNQLDQDDFSESEDEDEKTANYGPARRDTSDTIDREYGQQPSDELRSAAESLTSTIRSRKPQQTAEDRGIATGSTPLPSGTSRSVDPGLVNNESLLSHNRSEQENLTSSLVSMAQALKQQSIQFGATLESDKGSLDRAGEGLEKNLSGMEGAEKRMGTLRRMTEGKGWWGRMIMYAWIAGLWLAAFLIVFVMPKLRF